MAETERWFVYVLRCRGDRLYCGITKDLAGRLANHVAGRGAKFTRAFPPEAMIGAKAVEGRAQALREERAFKALPREKKRQQVDEWRDGVDTPAVDDAAAAG